jgi:HSP20 family molecular chaperone IbpA
LLALSFSSCVQRKALSGFRLMRPLVAYSPFESMLQKQQALVTVDVPGLKADDFHVSVEDDGKFLYQW